MTRGRRSWSLGPALAALLAPAATAGAPSMASVPQAAPGVAGIGERDDPDRWRAIVAAPQRSGDERLAALVALQDHGALDVPTVLRALGDGDEALQRAAAAVVRHEWFVLPDDLFVGLDRSPRAARAFLRELAVAPRPAATRWATLRMGDEPGRTRDDRLLAAAARGAPLTVAEADLLLQALVADEAQEGIHAALVVVPPKVADLLLGKLHAAFVAQRLDVDRAGPLLDRLSPAGVRQLLGLIVSLPRPVGVSLCQRLHDRAPELLAERTAAALDDPTPLDPVWVPYAGPCLDRPARCERVLTILADKAVAPEVREHAFLALASVGNVDARVLDHALADAGQRLPRVRRLLDAAIDALPTATIAAWLSADEQLANITVSALVRRRDLPAELAHELVEDLLTAGIADGLFLRPAAMALVQRGDAAALLRVWPLLRASSGWSDFVDAMARRPEPFVHELLVAELTATVPDVPVAARDAQLDAVALALATRGDARQLARLVTRAATAPPLFVRRCAHHVRVLPAADARTLLAQAGVTAEAIASESLLADETRVELVAWAANTVADPGVAAALLALWRAPASTPVLEELHEVALRALMASAHRAELVAELQAALAAGPLPPRLVPLPFEALNSMPSPLGPDDLALAIDLLLLPPRTDPEREAELVARWPDGTSGFPLVAAVAQRLRGADPRSVAAAFARALPAVCADPRRAAISVQRLLVLWRSLSAEPELQRLVGVATAPLARSDEPERLGPAFWFRTEAAFAAGDHEAAAAAARAAIAQLLRLGRQRGHARVFLGERDPAAGVDPWAALAALPHRADALAALARRDGPALAAAVARIREFAGHDAATLATLPSFPLPETLR